MQELAEAILWAAKIREESYDKGAAQAAINGTEFIDFNEFHTKTIKQAADEACEKVGFRKSMSEPIYLLLKGSWNDIIYWAKETIHPGRINPDLLKRN